MNSSPWLLPLSRLVLGIVLSTAAIAKLLHDGTAADPNSSWAEWIARAPSAQAFAAGIELFIAVSLASRAWKWGLAATVALAIAFLTLMLMVELQGSPATACGCFGSVPVSRTSHVLLAAGLGATALCTLGVASCSQPVASASDS